MENQKLLPDFVFFKTENRKTKMIIKEDLNVSKKCIKIKKIKIKQTFHPINQEPTNQNGQ